MEAEWFENWFDTKWYHILYQDRSYEEAEAFLDGVVRYLEIEESAVLLDAACGAGRHSIFLNKLGYNVHGFDLSSESISTAKKHESESLKFEVADLRNFVSDVKYDYIFSFFTSFGYFQNSDDNIQVLKRFKESLKSDGTILIDFMNAESVAKQLVSAEIVQKGRIEFNIERKVENEVIVKDIKFKTDGKNYNFQERVSAFNLSNFEAMFSEVGLRIEDTFGNYKLEPFSVENSPRLIMKIKSI